MTFGRILIGIAIVLAVAAAGAALTYTSWRIYVPGIIGNIISPVGPNRPVTWEEGPATADAAPGQRQPNIVVIIADDLGANDVSAFGGGVANGRVQTPAIDSIMREGTALRGGYSSHGTCSPTRAALMTGRHPSRIGFEYTSAPVLFARNIYDVIVDERASIAPPIYHADREKDVPPYETMGLPLGEVTIAELLRDRGYRTLMLGKWHLGDVPELQPHAQGFDEWLGITRGAALFGEIDDPQIVNSRQDFDPIDRFLWANLRFEVTEDGSTPFKPASYFTDYLGDEAVKAIRANRNRPFFLYLAFTAPHTPLQATKADYDALADIPDHTLRTYGAMIRSLDRNVGKVLAELEAQGLAENTLVIFTSDNGGANYVGLPDINKPYRGWKASFFEGGIHVPYFVRWPARIPATGARAPVDAASIDIFATAAAAANAPVPSDRPIDGIDLTPILSGEQAAPDRPLFWRAGGYRVVLSGGWKLQVAENPGKTWLFNLAADPTERNNLAGSEPAKVAELTALLDAYDKEAAKPLWPALVELPILIDHTINAPYPPDAEYVYWGN